MGHQWHPSGTGAGVRGYAEVSGKIELLPILPHQVCVNISNFRLSCVKNLEIKNQIIFTSTDATQVIIAAAARDMGILANHVPPIKALRPGVADLIESGNSSRKWFGEKRPFLGLWNEF